MASVPTSSATLALDAEGRVAIDLPCVGCGYNLRTLLHDARCPECARPVVESLRGDFLRFADPGWVKGLGRGLLLVLIAIGAGIVLPPLFFLAAVGTSGPEIMISVFIVGLIIGALAIGLAILGLHWLTRCDPAADPRREGWSARRMTRWSSWLLAAAPLYWLAIAISASFSTFTAPAGTPPISGPGFANSVALYMFGGVAAKAAYSVTPIVLMRHLVALLRRIPRPGLARFARIEFWGLLICLPMLVIGWAISMLAFMPMMTSAMAVAPTPAPLAAAASMPTSQMTVSTSYSYQVTTISSNVIASGSSTTMPTSFPTTTSMPASMPAFAAPTRGAAVGMMAGGVATMLGGCSTVVLSIAGLVLLIMACVAFNGAARDAAACAAEAANIGPPPVAPPPSPPSGM